MNNVYLVYGSDYSLVKREIDKIIDGIEDVAKYDLSVDKIDDLLNDASCTSIFKTRKALVGENALFLTSSITNVNHDLDYLNRYLLSDKTHENIVILSVISDKLDERKKIVKNLKNNSKVVYKEAIEQKNLTKFVMNEFKNEGYNIDYKTASYFVDYAGDNVDILLSEINKMIIYKDSSHDILIEDINDICCKVIKDNIFELCNGIIQKDYKKIFEIYNDLMILNEEPVKIIALLGKQFSFIYQVKLLFNDGESQKDISSKLKVHPYRVKLAIETNYKIKDIEEMIKKLHQLDYDIKSGAIDKNTGLDNFILHI